MSLYREPGRRSHARWIVAVLAGAALVAIGFGIGRVTAPSPSLESQLADLRADAGPAADALELVAIHYGSSDATTREAAQAQLDRAESSFAGIEDELRIVNPQGAGVARAAIMDLASLVSSGAPAEEVEEAAADAEDAVRAAAGVTS